MAQLPELKKRQEEAEKRAGQGKYGPEGSGAAAAVSTSDPETRRMKMPNGALTPPAIVQLATDTQSRAVVGVEVSNEGSDAAGVSEPIRGQVEHRTQGKIEQHRWTAGTCGRTTSSKRTPRE